ncbi:hypothetical protein JXA12_05365 [Candidatus Woesearchaeota archaeon]|nr:hypothetical protein [Candidatus Woesearchaeota archaeon]
MRKGQAAMEFLMTYGWAILVVLAAIGALAYFGVLSPGKLLPERTVFKAPIPSIDNAIVYETGYSIEIPFRNNKGESIRIADAAGNVSANGDCPTAGMGLTAEFTNGTDITLGTSGHTIPNGESFLLTFTCTNFGGKTAGDKFKSDLTFAYITPSTGQVRPHSGAVDAEILA